MTAPLHATRGSGSHKAASAPIALFAAAVGVVVLPLYASQPLVGIIGPDLGLPGSLSGLATTLTLLGYAMGLFFLVPLVDILENKRLVLVTLAGDAAALLGVALSRNGTVFLVACFAVGLLTSAIQMLVPAAASLSPESQRGRTIGNVMSALMLGILFSRPVASLVTHIAGWRILYGLLALCVATLAAVLCRRIPTLQPPGRASYRQLLASLISILKAEPILRRRAASQAMCMGAFGVFWTSVALRLAQAPFALGQEGIAAFALAGAAGAIIAPVAGRAGDRGWTHPMTLLAHAAVMTAMALAWFGGASRTQGKLPLLAALSLAAVVLDLGVIADQTLGRRAINLLRPEARGRLNGLFTGLFFLGGAAGSALSGIAWHAWGWTGVCAVGFAFGAAAMATSLTHACE